VQLVQEAPAAIEAVGIQTLVRMADVHTYNEWVYRAIEPYLGDRLLEVGCGIGNMTPYYADRPLLVGVDLLAESLALVHQKLGDRPNVRTVCGDICAEATIAALIPYRLDTAIMLNVLEHIADDARALAAVRATLAPGGRLLLLVPAERYLYGSLDHALGHYRRYEPSGLRALLHAGGWEIESLRYMNLPGILGWFLNGRVLHRRLLPRFQLALFNLLGPLFERLERLIPPPRGQSLLAICRKPV
jgi:SAM-dependent methyltransferase